MKKLAVPLLFLCAVPGFAQMGDTSTQLLNTAKYLSYFSVERSDIFDSYVAWSASAAELERFAGLTGEAASLDTPLEFALLSYYSPAIMNTRPMTANTALPPDNSRLAGLKLGAAAWQELLALRFIDPQNTAAIDRYETMLEFIQDSHGLDRAAIESYFRDGIRGLVSEIVNDEYDGVPVPPATVSYIIQSLGDFCLTPNRANFDTLKTIYHSTDELYNLRSIIAESSLNAAALASVGLREAAEGVRNLVRSGRESLNEGLVRLRIELHAPADAEFNWEMFHAPYHDSLVNLLNDKIITEIQTLDE